MRYLILDNLKGIAFILMVIQHIFYFYDVSNNYRTSYRDNIFISTCGLVARVLFIFLIGINMNLTKNVKKRFQRSFEIAIHALIISLVTFIFYPDIFVKFGILHFISVATILGIFFIDRPKLTLLFILIFILYKPTVDIHPIINLIIGSKNKYDHMDYFPLFPWFGLVLLGMYIGKMINLNELTNIKFLNSNNILTYFGQNSLNLYTGHVIFLIVIYSIKNKLKIIN